MIRDRGRIKWTAMMLPEHVEQLRDWLKEEMIPSRREPDDQQYEEWNYLITSAMESNTPLSITYWENGKQFNEVGFIHHLDQSIQALRFITSKEIACVIPLLEIESISEFE